MSVLTMPGEISGQLIKPMRRKSGNSVAVWSLNGQYTGYVVPRHVYDLGTESQGQLFKYETQTMSFLGLWGADYLLNIGTRLVDAVHKKQ